MISLSLFLRLGPWHVIKQETHIFTKMIITKSSLPNYHYQIFLKIHEILPKVKLFTKSGHTVDRT